MKKKSIFTLVLTTISFCVFSQSRQNRENLSFDKKSEKVTEATGWELNKETGKWVENKNVIDKSICSRWWISHLNQNFKSIEFASIKYEGKDYYIMLIEKASGSWKYPNIKQDWQEYKEMNFFIITDQDFKSIQDIVDKKDGMNHQIISKFHNQIDDQFSTLGGEHQYSHENLLAKITTTLQKGSYDEKCLTINSQVVDGIEVIRFRLPEYCVISRINKDSYFEISKTEFIKLLSLK